MATYARTLRRGLPRRPGAEPWPPAGAVSPAAAVSPDTAASTVLERPEAPPAAVETTQPVVPVHENRTFASSGASRTLRRGLPRTPGGEPWPPASTGPVAGTPVGDVATSAAAGLTPNDGAMNHLPHQESTARMPHTGVEAPENAENAVTDAAARPLRRGLPRTTGGDPWPAAGFAPAEGEAGVSSHPARSTTGEGGVSSRFARSTTGEPDEPATASPAAPTETATAPAPGTSVAPTALDAAVDTAPRVLAPLRFTPTVFPGVGGRAKPQPQPEPRRYGPFTRLQWVGAAIIGGGGLLFAAGMAVLAVRWLLSLEPLQDFLTTYPGEYHLPEGAPVGVPSWLGWQHFFNVFLMVLIIRTGLQVRNEKRPSVFWSPRTNAKRKISLGLWFHQSLDILWIVNGAIFVVLLFVTGQWMKIVPTSWEVFPNAISAALQYVSLDWPTENGWVNYNSLQQLAYFTTVFIAAPLAIATGVRMSGIWPKNAKALNKAYPVEWARAVHFPVMLYFVFFIIVHVALVFATGALRNLNHMYASLGSVDGMTYADNWTGFWIFAISMLVIAAGWVAARPLVLAPIARLFGKVSGR